MPVDYDVIVVGAGPIGLTTALLLRQFGHNVTVLERHARRYPQPRAVGIYHQGIRAFGALKLLDNMFEAGALHDLRGVVDNFVSYVDGDGQVLSQHPFNATLSKSGTALSYAMHQPTLEEQLETACQQRGIKVHRSIEVNGVVDAGDRVEVSTRGVNGNEKDSGTAENLTAWFVAGCDGSHSTVRKSANINYHEYEAASSRWLVVDVTPITANSSRQWKDGYRAKQYLDPKRPRTSVPSPSSRRRWEFMVMPDESTELAMSDEFIWKLLAPFDCGPETAVIERRTVYSIGGGWVETFAEGRIALAGDAAHLAPQFLGQGLNSGLRDAKSLAWRLDFALRNPEDNWPTLLADYSAEQLGTTKQFVVAAKGVEKFLTVTDPGKAKVRDATIKEGKLNIPNLERVGAPGMHLRDDKTQYDPSCEPGTLFIQDKVEIDGKEGLFDNVVGEGWVLIAEDAADLGALSLKTQRRYKSLFGGHLIHFSGPGSCKDISGRYKEWLHHANVKAVLVRPDYYIYGTAKTADEIEQLVKGALDHVSS